MKNNKFLSLFNQAPEELKNLAFTHSSYANQNKIESNERLEFLGDSVLSLCISDYFYKNYKRNEGKLSKVRSTVVCTDSIANIAKEFFLKDKLKVGKSFKGRELSDAMLEDMVESMIAVVYLTHGLKTTQTAVLELLKVKSKLKKGVKQTDYKTELQEFCQSKKMKLEYVCSNYTTKGGQTNFKSGVKINGAFYKYGTGSTKRESEQNAARLSLKILQKGETRI